MQKSRFSETQIVLILKEIDAGMPVTKGSCKHGISLGDVLQVEVEVWWPGGRPS